MIHRQTLVPWGMQPNTSYDDSLVFHHLSSVSAYYTIFYNSAVTCLAESRPPMNSAPLIRQHPLHRIRFNLILPHPQRITRAANAHHTHGQPQNQSLSMGHTIKWITIPHISFILRGSIMFSSITKTFALSARRCASRFCSAS